MYCQNCALTLSDLKNLCWFCNEPIDESKPVQPYKLEEEEIKKRLEKSEKST